MAKIDYKKIDYKKIAIVIAWVLMALFLHKAGLITTNPGKIKRILDGDPNKTTLMFLFLSTFRILLFIPSAVLAVLGGTIFGPLKGLILSIIGLAASESIVFFIGKYYVGKKANDYLYSKYGNIMRLMEKYRDKFLIVSMLCPIAPLDAICFVSSSFGYSYKRFVGILIATHIPFFALCSLLGESYEKSAANKIVIILLMLVLLIYTAKVWKSFNKELKGQVEA